MRHLHAVAVAGLGFITARADAAVSLTCPQSIAAGTLTMACSAACPNALSPCLYYANANDCVAEADSGSVCVSSPLEGATCAIECFSPFSGTSGNDTNEAWNLMLTDEGEYKRDVAAEQTRDPTFRLAKKANTKIRAIHDLRFPSTARTISISGNALPIRDKAVDYPVIYHGDTVDVDMKTFSFLDAATEATTIRLENINLTALGVFPKLPQLTALDVSLNTLITIPSGALPMTLVDLCLQDCALEELPPNIASMTRLKKLDLSGNKFSLPPAGSLPLQVEHLIWWGLYHKVLPPDFPSMTKLKKLEIGWNDFSNAAALALLPASLEELHLVDVKLSEVPASFYALKSLAWLYCCPFVVIGKSVDTMDSADAASCSWVFHRDLAINLLHNVSTETLPPATTFLNLSVNWISSIKENALPVGIETLDLHVNSLTCNSLPSDLSRLTKLKTLYLHENQLDCVPPAIFHLPALETLTLHRNANLTRMTFNTSELAFLGKLKGFHIDQHSLDTACELPTAIGKTAYIVCVTEKGSSGSKRGNGGGKASGDGNRGLIVGLAVAIGGMIAILIGAVHWKRRHHAHDAMAMGAVGQYPGDDDKGAKEFWVIEEEIQRRHNDGDGGNGGGASDATAYTAMATSVDDSHRKMQQQQQQQQQQHASSNVAMMNTAAATSTASGGGSSSSSSTISSTTAGGKTTKTTTTKKTTTTTTSAQQASASSSFSSSSSSSASSSSWTGKSRFETIDS